MNATTSGTAVVLRPDDLDVEQTVIKRSDARVGWASSWIVSGVLVATSLTPIASYSDFPQALVGEQSMSPPAAGSVLDAIRSISGVTEDQVSQLLGLKGGRHTLRRWRKGEAIRSDNFQRLLAVRRLLEDLDLRVPDLRSFLFTPVYAAGPTPYEMISEGRDRAVLGVAQRQIQRQPRQSLPKFKDIGGGPIDYMDHGGD